MVGALDQNSNRCDFSNYGEYTVDIYAPGADILSIIPIDYCGSRSNIVNSDYGPKRRCECNRNNNNWYFVSEHVADGYHYKSGTSFATPMVTGVAALLSSINPELTASQLKECILGGADNITIMVGDNNNEPQNVKKLNAWGAFKYLMDHDDYYTYELNETHSIGSDSNVKIFTDSIVSIQSYSSFKENTSFIKLALTKSGDCTFNISSTEDFKMVLYNSDFEPMLEELSSNSNINSTYYLPASTYYIKTNLEDAYEGYGGVSINYSINYATHVHSYTE